MDVYKSDQINFINIDAIDKKTVRITYSPMLETLYFSPGLNVKEASDMIQLSFIRCPIKEKCKVTHIIQPNSNGNYIIEVEHNEKPIYMSFDKERVKLFPQ